MNPMDQNDKREQYLWVDSSLCIGCYSCEVACKMEHDLPAEPRPIMMIQIGPLEYKDEPAMMFLPTTCHHCTNPACVAACPRGAMQKRGGDIVISDPELCIGCQTCALACPFGIPQLNPGLGKIAKCDGCVDRVEQGLTPVCVLACPTEAMSFMTPAMQSYKARERAALAIRQFSPYKG